MSRMLRNERRAQRNSLISFGIPLLVAGSILIIVLKAFFSSPPDDRGNSGDAGVNVLPKGENSEIYLYMSGDSNKKLEGEAKLFRTDNRLEVRTGEAELSIEGSAVKIWADRLAEIGYRGLSDGKHTFELMSSYAWIDSPGEDTVFKLKGFTVAPKADSVIALYQNAVGSSVYVLKGRASVSTETSNTEVGVNQMLGIISSEAKTAKLPESIRPIDSLFRTADVYLRHNGDSYLLSAGTGSPDGTFATGSGSESVQPGAASKPIVFTNPEDEASVETASVDVEGKIVHPKITKITINEKEAKIDVESKTFSFKGFPLPSNRNDLVYRAFDADGNIIAKGILTVYSSAKTADASTAAKPTVTTFPIADKEFQIVAPSENPYKTTENVVRMEGRLPKGAVKYVTVNGFRLSKFPQYGTYWYYFANKDYGTMNDGINTYEIKYYGSSDELLKTSQFIIVKEVPAEPASAPATESPADSGTGSGSAGNSSL